MDLESFLVSAGLLHLKETMLEEGMDLDILLQANDTELAQLTTKLVDKIKLRAALENLRLKKCTSPELGTLSKDQPTTDSVVTDDDRAVALPVRQNASIFLSIPEDINDYTLQDISPSCLTSQPTTAAQDLQQEIFPSINLPESESYSGSKDLSSYLLENEYQLLGDYNLVYSPQPETKKNSQKNNEKPESGSDNLQQLMTKDTTGRRILEKFKSEQVLTPRDRAYIVKLVVESELRLLDKLNNTIRRDVWLRWAEEISNLFKGESRHLYYVPYHVVDGKVVQASGLIHYRLITHRRALASETKKRTNSDSSSDSGRSSSASHDKNIKRVRPLPDSFVVTSPKVNLQTQEEQLDWLRGSSTPFDTVLTKWKATFALRVKFLESHSYLDYFKKFPALLLPNGYKLLKSDFERVYPDGNDTFLEKFPIIKIKILKLLAERGESSKADLSTLELLQLASEGEEQANVAALLGIINLLRQMPTVSVPKKKVWKLTREEARNSFLARVTTAADIDCYCIQREIVCTTKGIPNQPFILAVGPSWSNVTQYEIVINKGMRYQLPNICSALMHMFNIYWALDCAYPRESAPCWMLIQRSMFQITSKFDIEGVPLRELLQQLVKE